MHYNEHFWYVDDFIEGSDYGHAALIEVESDCAYRENFYTYASLGCVMDSSDLVNDKRHDPDQITPPRTSA